MEKAKNTPITAANHYSSLAPRFWHGMRAGVWWRLLAENRFRISPSRIHIALGVTAITPINDVLATVQRMFHQRRIQATELCGDPIFILGHWRSGTTLLHELLMADRRFASPNTYQCFAPSHFLVSTFVPRYGNFLLPKKRPMDNMAAGWMLPQEDEFALMNLGLPSPYLRIAFPHSQNRFLEYLDMQGLSSEQLDRWKNGFLWFVKALTRHYGDRRLVLKSPPHTGRIGQLSKMFPNARYIHLVRDPRQLFPSTMRLWRSLDQVQSLQTGLSEPQITEYVCQCMQRMYRGFHAHRDSIPAEQIMDVCYEDLVANPKATVRQIYDQLNLGDYEEISARLGQMLEGHREYQVNRHQTDPKWQTEVVNYCADYAHRYGYSEDASIPTEIYRES
jgi:omega-hydroxy-beta-dihydromenaquinone-9 sulfotransferase